jgi:Methyltransferase domain
VRHVRDFSSLALRAFDGPVDLLFVDGAHRFGPARSDLVRWGARVPSGGRMLVHDAFSSVGVTLALLSSVVPSRSWRYVGREGSLAAYVRERSDGFGRELGELGFFARNLGRKGLIAAGLRDGPWPH